MERDRSKVVAEFLGFAIKAEGDPIGQVGRLQAEALKKYIQNRKSNVLGINVLGSLYAFPDSTLGSIGKANNITGERVRKISEKTLTDIWERSPKGLKRKYPLAKLSDGRVSKLRGVVRRVAELVESRKSPEEIMTELDIRGSKLVRIGRALKERGVEVGYIGLRGKRFAAELEKSESDAETQALLDTVDRNLLKCAGRAKDMLASIASICKESGFHAQNRYIAKFAETLAEAGIPVGRVEYSLKGGKNAGRVMLCHFVAFKDKKRAKRVLLNDSELDRFKKNPVAVFCGPASEKLPTLWECMKRRGVKPVHSIMKKFGIHFGGRASKSVHRNFLTPDCPVTIFKYRGGHLCCREEDIPGFEKHIKRRLAELGKVG